MGRRIVRYPIARVLAILTACPGWEQAGKLGDERWHNGPTPASDQGKTNTYTFILILTGVSEITPEMAETLFAACDDLSPWSSEGVVSVGFDREADSLGDAVGLAIKDIEKAGFAVARVEVEPVKS